VAAGSLFSLALTTNGQVRLIFWWLFYFIWPFLHVSFHLSSMLTWIWDKSFSLSTIWKIWGCLIRLKIKHVLNLYWQLYMKT
jgi:hypothetical protein